MSNVKRGRPAKRGRLFRNVNVCERNYVENTRIDSYRSHPKTRSSLSLRNAGLNETGIPEQCVNSHALHFTNDEIANPEFKKLSPDQNDSQVTDFDPEKSQREMCKMNRRSKKNQLYDDRGVLLGTHLDLCDCLEKDCPGCHLPCQRCGSLKCGTDCRCNRKFTVDLIEVEGTNAIYNFPI
uniref:ARF7 effector protein C-terminal domain-containing protein n=2 Tax=Arion vulgaris TaxID=1028688 RepID=A0A0B6ZDG2_9EUPU